MGFVTRFGCEDPKCWAGRGRKGDAACSRCQAKLNAELDQAWAAMKKAKGSR